MKERAITAEKKTVKLVHKMKDTIFLIAKIFLKETFKMKNQVKCSLLNNKTKTKTTKKIGIVKDLKVLINIKTSLSKEEILQELNTIRTLKIL